MLLLLPSFLPLTLPVRTAATMLWLTHQLSLHLSVLPHCTLRRPFLSPSFLFSFVSSHPRNAAPPAHMPFLASLPATPRPPKACVKCLS